jgi:DNA polymerase-3 subunit gamma/tau
MIYNEERPLTLSQVKGQEKIVTQLRAMFKSGATPNSLLFVGPRGTGKTTVARIVAKFLNCENPADDPCNDCKSCRDIMAGTSLDVTELDAASNNKVEDVHGIIDAAQYAPVGKRKVFILDEVHMFSQGAWNALLKILEEPPAGVTFILCTTELQKVPATIISRCRKFTFERIPLEVVEQQLADICDKRGKAYESNALTYIASMSQGCMRDAESMLESFLDNDSITEEVVLDVLGMSGTDTVFDVLDGITAGDPVAALSAVKAADKRGQNMACLVKEMIQAVTDAEFLLQGASSIIGTKAYKDRLAAFAQSADMDRCLQLTKELSDVYGSISRNADAEFCVETAVLRTIEYQSEISKLRVELEELKQKVASGIPVVSGAQEPIQTMPVQATPVSVPTAEAEEDPATADEPDTGMDFGDTLPGDISQPAALPAEAEDAGVPWDEDKPEVHLPEGTRVTGTVSIFSKMDKPVTETENVLDEAGDAAPKEQQDDDGFADDFGDMFSGLVRQ